MPTRVDPTPTMCSDETRKWKTHSSTREIGAVGGVHPDSFNSGEKSGLDVTPTEIPNEEATLHCLRKAEQLANRFTGTHPSSLGLHPAVYFYSATGRHQPTSVLAIAALIIDLEKEDLLNEFTRVRTSFEDFLHEYKVFINQLTSRYGSMAKGFRPIRDYYRFVLNLFIQGKNPTEVGQGLKEYPTFQTLVKEKPILTNQPKKFSQAVKQLAVITEVLNSASRCHICGARIDLKAMHIDHKQERSGGGLGTADNSQVTHPYCDCVFR